MRALTRAREDLVQTRVALANRLRAELEAFWPGAARIFAEVDSPISLSFLERYPSPDDARRLGEKRLAGFLARNRYCGRKSAAELVEQLRSAPRGRASEAEIEARRTAVLALVAALRPLVEQIGLLSSQIAGAVRSHADGEVFLSLFRDPKSSITAACLVAEIGDCRARYPTSEAMAADAGMCPVAVESGKRKVAAFRRACDHRLRDAVAVLANATRHHNSWAKDVYRRARARGCDHPHAIRVLGRAWVRSSGACGRTASPTIRPATAIRSEERHGKRRTRYGQVHHGPHGDLHQGLPIELAEGRQTRRGGRALALPPRTKEPVVERKPSDPAAEQICGRSFIWGYVGSLLRATLPP